MILPGSHEASRRTVNRNWVQYTKTYSDLSKAETTNSIVLFTLEPMEYVYQVVMKHSQAFMGGSISAYTLKIGINGVLGKYSSTLNAFQDPGSTIYTNKVQSSYTPESETTKTEILLTAECVDDTLNRASQGSVDIYVLKSFMDGGSLT